MKITNNYKVKKRNYEKYLLRKDTNPSSRPSCVRNKRSFVSFGLGRFVVAFVKMGSSLILSSESSCKVCKFEDDNIGGKPVMRLKLAVPSELLHAVELLQLACEAVVLCIFSNPFAFCEM